VSFFLWFEGQGESNGHKGIAGGNFDCPGPCVIARRLPLFVPKEITERNLSISRNTAQQSRIFGIESSRIFRIFDYELTGVEPLPVRCGLECKRVVLRSDHGFGLQKLTVHVPNVGD